MLITTWNAPEETFTTPGELMYQRPPDEGVFYGFHKMCSFIGLEPIEGFHFYDVVKDINDGADSDVVYGETLKAEALLKTFEELKNDDSPS